MFTIVAASALLLALRASAQGTSPVWGQCGGQNWGGPTTCAAGSTCVFNSPFYSQCLPGSGSTSQTQSPTSSPPVSTTSSAGPAPTDAGNPYVGYNVFLIPEYVDEVKAAVANISDSATATKAAKLQNIPVFFWMDVAAKVPLLGTYLAAANAAGGKQLLQAVIYDLPDRDCAALASNGEYSIANNGAANYKAYIDAIVAQVNKFPNVRVVFVVEPDSLPNIVTNSNVQKCANAASTYQTLTSYAISKLQQPNVFLYLDAGHAGWLGWPANINPAAQLFSNVLKAAGSGAKVRGMATNVANYNLIRGPEDPAQAPNPNFDEEHYINAFAPLLSQNGFPAHFIVDQSRSGVSGLRTAEGDWCNVKGAGLGTHPTTSTGNSLMDAILTTISGTQWVKPPGESDGTSSTSSARFDAHCGQSDAAQPAPEAGTWFQDYFVTLVKNANPAL